jgi:hypothetical protein
VRIIHGRYFHSDCLEPGQVSMEML